MGKQHYDWWPYAKKMIYKYPSLAQRHNLQSVRITQNYSGMPGSGGASRTTEEQVIKWMSKTEEREYQAVHLAIRQTNVLPDGDARVELIRLLYWQRKCNLHGAAKRLHVSYRTAQRWHSAFIIRVGFNYDSRWAE